MSLFGLISSANAQTTGAPSSAQDMFSQILQGPVPMILMVGVIFYFLLIRPQNQKAKQLAKQLSELKRGDSVVTAGGIIGTVFRIVSDTELTIEIAEGVRVRVVRSTVTGIAAKGEPRTDEEADKPKPARKGKTPPASVLAAEAANESKPEA